MYCIFNRSIEINVIMLVGKRITWLYVQIRSGRRPKTLKEKMTYCSLNKTFLSLYKIIFIAFIITYYDINYIYFVGCNRPLSSK